MTDFNENNLNPENNINNASGNEIEIENANSVNPNYNNPYYSQQSPIVTNFEPVNYTPVKPKSPIATGVKIFAILLAFLIFVTGSCLAGYLFGVYSEKKNNSNFSETTLNLAAKPADTDEYTAAQVYEMVNPSIVGIKIYNEKGNGGTASGVIYEDGYIITNDHIYSEVPSAKFIVETYDGKQHKAEFVAGDTRSDLAVLRIESKEYTPAVFGNSDELIIGENVVAIGRPDQIEENSITEGIVSLKSRRVSITTNYSTKMIQTSTPINPGNSGGALVNMYGQVVGITSSKNVGQAYEGIGYAIPTTTAKAVVESLIEFGCVNDRSRLGITYQFVDQITKEIYGYSNIGIYISEVSTDSDLYGKVFKGDIIVAVNDIKIDRSDVILDLIESSKPGDVIQFTVITENGETKTISAKLLPDTGNSSYVTE